VSSIRSSKRSGISTKSCEHKGLGTYVIHPIVKKHHGWLDFRYEGTTFRVKIKLPILKKS
jgi:two-component system, LytTR family, sensor histidine kinase NatK